MKIERISAAYHAARRADEARLDAMEAADQARLSVNWTGGDQVVAIESAAVAALLAAKCPNPTDTKLRGATLAAVSASGDYEDILATYNPAAKDRGTLVNGNGAIQ